MYIHIALSILFSPRFCRHSASNDPFNPLLKKLRCEIFVEAKEAKKLEVLLR